MTAGNGMISDVEEMLDFLWKKYGVQYGPIIVHPRDEAKAIWNLLGNRIEAVGVWLSDTHARTLKQWWFDRPWNF